MSKSQIRKQSSEVREYIRCGIEALNGPSVDLEARIEAGILWLNGAVALSREAEMTAIKTVHEAESREARIGDLERAERIARDAATEWAAREAETFFEDRYHFEGGKKAATAIADAITTVREKRAKAKKSLEAK